MELSKHLEPHMSFSFEELSDVLLQNYKESSSVGSGSFLSGISGGKSGAASLPAAVNTAGFNNNLRDKVGSPDVLERSVSNTSLTSDILFDVDENVLTPNALRRHNILEAKNESK
jgi:hypothetical protein